MRPWRRRGTCRQSLRSPCSQPQATDPLRKVLDKPPASIFVVIDEVDTDNRGVAGESVSALRRRQAPRTS
ncbi:MULTISPECIES: tautomerase family protein [Pseudomonas aeruginosa group]|uniref:tautomerase family protein n=1 Tax=Pseudomonas aeruginosa group TaxID=136841 RepID=UPI0008FB9A1C|nr:tautomerase family protein [Pseudomonas paraeruginosa]MBG3906364.1 tautomerase family protein [Pseudomonas aeruginosa]AVR68121.1 hypothetical protein B7D75_14660 [Pseudomonas paraeruginosa]MBG4203098.1 tautomerase family protein [Pseudomonas aeruginosa]MBG4281224.1 tautomerase family protein [Pseudomonas aeruginosa]MBG6893242.1 tautomerase family protein [Pseudomonas aeruginosa]